MKTCAKCGVEKRSNEFHRDNATLDGLVSHCKACRNATTRESQRRRRAERLASNFESLKPEDFDVEVGNDGRIDRKAAEEKRQEYSKAMGEFAQELHDVAEGAAADGEDVLDLLPEQLGSYIGRLSEQERRFGNRRLARSVSLAAAHEALALRQFKQAATTYLRDKIEPTGYALKPSNKTLKRTVCLLLSDLHLGADLSALDNPMPFRAIEEARRLEFIVRQAIDFKPQYREHSEMLLLLNGDLIDGMLMHDWRDGAPLTEQKVVFWRAFRAILGVLAQTFPRVRVECQPGNHGRDKLRHPGRASSSKWDGHEWQMYWALKEMCSSLPNVSFSLPWQAVSIVDLYGSKLLLSHGDTEIKLGNPDTASAKNAMILDRINSTKIYGHVFSAAAFGHWHMPRYQPRNPRIIWNGALLPPNGYARTEGWIGEPTGQWLWEAVEGFPIGDLRYIEVGPAQDKDERLGQIVKPFRFE